MFPPMGFLSFPPNIAALASGEDMTWFVRTTATPYWTGFSEGSKSKEHMRDVLHLLIFEASAKICQGEFVVQTVLHVR